MTWAKVALAELTTKIGSGATPKGGDSSYKDTGTPLIRSMNVHDGEFRAKGLAFIDDAQAGLLNNVTLRADDVLLNITGASVARVCTVPKAYTGGRVNQHVAIIRPKADKLLPKYLEHYLINPQTKAELLGIAGAGATREAITKASIETLEIPLPPLEEQKRIAAILDQADALRRLRARALDRLNALGQAIFHEMFGDPRTNPMGWPVRPLAEIGELERGVSKHRPRNEPALLGGDHALIQTGDVSRAGDYIMEFLSTYSDLGLRQSRKWPKGTLCITIAANIADTAILNFDACFPDSVVGFNSGDEATNFFVHRWFATVKSHLEQIAPAVAQKNINLAILRELPIIQPDHDLITEFFVRETALRTQKSRSDLACKEMDTLFTSLQHRAFRGEL